MLNCSLWFSAPSFWVGGGIKSCCVGRVYGADGARNNAFQTRIIRRLYDTMMHKKPNSKKTHKKKWITLTYHRPVIKKKVNLFKHTNLSIVYQAANTLYNRLQNTQEVQHKFQKVVSINSHTEHVMSHT